jgi:aryl-alcohol dehydrogenase-like predicted oxidoreductase
MKYYRVGQSGIHVSAVCLGTMLFGTRVEKAAANRIVDMAREAGVNFVDTAYSYGEGASEQSLGETIARDRGKWILATKVGSKRTTGINESGLGRRRIIESLETSLKRLKTDYLDIYYFHTDDREASLEETLYTIGDVIRQGKVRYFGLSNHAAWRVAHVWDLCQVLNVPQPVICQPYYNLINRSPEVELLPACEYFSLGVAPYSPIARGILTGKYLPGLPPPPDSRAGKGDATLLKTEYREESMIIAQKVREYAATRGMTTTQFAYAWTLNTAQVCASIAGPRTEEQWKEYLEVADRELDAADEAFVDSLVKPGHVSTHGYTDPRYPVEGRRPRAQVAARS